MDLIIQLINNETEKKRLHQIIIMKMKIIFLNENNIYVTEYRKLNII